MTASFIYLFLRIYRSQLVRVPYFSPFDIADDKI